ncbi:30S ribosomal protein S17 [Patescibacteria group bacterium]|nr:30S ribosomal protein S17 [Patescibacteria group bacterium]
MEKTVNTTEKKVNRKTMSGVVTSDKMKDTIVVEVSRFIKHPKYGKYVSINKKFKAHDTGNTKKIGDKVTIEECAPISKDKKFRII